MTKKSYQGVSVIFVFKYCNIFISLLMHFILLRPPGWFNSYTNSA